MLRTVSLFIILKLCPKDLFLNYDFSSRNKSFPNKVLTSLAEFIYSTFGFHCFIDVEKCFYNRKLQFNSNKNPSGIWEYYLTE